MLISILSQESALAGGTKPWTLRESAGDVRLIKANFSPIALTTGDVFSDGDWIETGPDGQAVLTRGEERIVVAPNSRIGLPRTNTGPLATRILQTLGTILLTVEKKATQHFEVQTPYLTAMVKGTTFTVSIQGQRTMVHVVEGLVEVRDLVSGQGSLVRPGQTGTVLSDSGSGVSVQGGSAAAAKPAAPATSGGRDKRVHSNVEAQADDAIVIREALGPKSIDLTVATGGLVREQVSALGGVDAESNSDIAQGAAIGAVRTATAAGVTPSTSTAAAGAAQPAASALANAAQPAANALTSAAQPATSAVASVTQSTASTLTSVTQPATTTLTSVTQTATSTVASVTQATTSTLATVIQPVTTTVASVTQSTTSTATSTVNSTVNLLKGLLH